MNRKRLSLLLCGLSVVGLVAANEGTPDDDWAVVLGEQLKRIDRDTSDSAARNRAWKAAMHLGLFEQAAALGATLNEAERLKMVGDQIALAIRHGKIDRDTLAGAQRFHRLDLAIRATDNLHSDFVAGQAVDGEDRRRLIDRLSALALRGRARDAVDLYGQLVARRVEVSHWAKQDVAGSYLEIRQPAQAIVLYRAVIAANPDDFSANLGLFYALFDNQLPDEAVQHIDAFAARLPVRRHRDGKFNGESFSADLATDQARIYSDRLAEAQARLAEKNLQAPFNSELRQANASLALARGWPELGRKWLFRAQGSDPENPAIHAELAEASLRLQDWQGARQSLAQGMSLDPQHGAVRRAGISLNLHERPELFVDAGYGQGNGSEALGNRDWHVDTWLYSRPLAERWRLYFHNYTSIADFNAGTAEWVRNGFGGEWRWQVWRLTAEINGGSGAAMGLTTTARWQPSDYLTVYGAHETRTNDIPLRAVHDGVEASKRSVGIDLRAHESRKLSGGVERTDFSDGNQRSRVNVAWQERWLSGPVGYLETTLGADASGNTLLRGFSYFNPKNDRSAWFTAAGEHLVWRSYNYALWHRLALTLGRYWQLEHDFPAGNMQAVEYSQRCELDRDLSVRYSIGRSLRPYDGIRESRTYGTLSVLWRF